MFVKERRDRKKEKPRGKRTETKRVGEESKYNVCFRSGPDKENKPLGIVGQRGREKSRRKRNPGGFKPGKVNARYILRESPSSRGRERTNETEGKVRRVCKGKQEEKKRLSRRERGHNEEQGYRKTQKIFSKRRVTEEGDYGRKKTHREPRFPGKSDKKREKLEKNWEKQDDRRKKVARAERRSRSLCVARRQCKGLSRATQW